MSAEMDRRDFMKKSAAAGVGVALAGTAGRAGAQQPDESVLFTAPPMERVRVGFVGTGGQGSGHVRNLTRIANVEVVAVCDINESNAARAQDIVERAGHPRPEAYTRGDYDFQRMNDRDDIDLVYTATPWRWHVPVCVDAMEKGKHAATEIPAAYTIEDCWKLVETAERMRRHCCGMENCNYDRVEMQIWNMVRAGLFGEVLHGECGYLHDLRGIKFSRRGEGLWRRDHATYRNGNLYPTHGLGPMAQCFDINRGDAFDYIVSMSSPSRGLQLYQEERLDADDPRRDEKYVLGDVNTSMIMTKNGKTIVVQHDCNLPRPYSRDFLVQGTRGIARKYPQARVYIEGEGRGERWNPLDDYREQYEHPLWVKQGDTAQGAGHGGMDYLEDFRLIQSLLRGEPMDQDVYDSVSLAAVCELSERSVASKSRALDFPDFTRGKWKVRPPLPIVSG